MINGEFGVSRAFRSRDSRGLRRYHRRVRFDDRFLDEIKSRLRLSEVIGKSVKLRRQGREYVGLSPFTKERTPSFFVNDDKGFYHDFSSGKHGDLISFLQETERLTCLERTVCAERWPLRDSSRHTVNALGPGGLFWRMTLRLGWVVAATIVMVTPAAGAAWGSPLAIVEVPGATGVAGVVVTAKRPKEQTLIDRKVYTVSDDLRTATGTAADVLNQIPSVDVDADGNITLRGDGAITVLVDGKPSAQFSNATRGQSLLQLPAQDIDRIEVMTNPPAQYKAEGSAGVINIITRKTKKPGFSGSANLSLGDKRRFVASLTASYNVGKLRLSGGVTLRQDARERVITTHRTMTDPVTGVAVLSQERLDEHLRRLIPLVKFGADYNLNDRETVGLSLSHRELSGDRFFDQHDQSASAAGIPISLSDRHSDGHEWSVDNGQSVRFDQKLWRPDETLGLSVQRSVTRERERYAYTNIDTLPLAPPTQDDLRLSLDLVTIEFGADYQWPISATRNLKLGFDLEDDDDHFDNTGDTVDPATGLPVNNPGITSHFRHHQDIYTVYGEYQTRVGKWSVQSGLRLEQTDADSFQITGAIPGAQNYFRAYPSLNLDRALSERAKLSLSISRRVTRPDPEALNPFIDYQDTHNLRAGNAKLLPQDTWSYELGYASSIKALNYGLTAYYRFDRDSVTDLTSVVSADVVLVTKTNLPKSRAAGLEFTADGKVLSQLSYIVSGNLFYSQIDAAALGASGLRSTMGLNLKASLQYKPTSADTAQISFSRTDRRLTAQGYVDAINLVNVGYRRQIRSNLAAVITLSDGLDGQRYHRVVNTPGLIDDYTRYQVGHVAYVGVIYTFGSSRKSKPAGFDYDS